MPLYIALFEHTLTSFHWALLPHDSDVPTGKVKIYQIDNTDESKPGGVGEWRLAHEEVDLDVDPALSGLVRFQTTCNAAHLRDFIEQYPASKGDFEPAEYDARGWGSAQYVLRALQDLKDADALSEELTNVHRRITAHALALARPDGPLRSIRNYSEAPPTPRP